MGWIMPIVTLSPPEKSSKTNKQTKTITGPIDNEVGGAEYAYRSALTATSYVLKGTPEGSNITGPIGR